MKIGVISDTHGNVSAFRKALTFFDGVDIIVHAGDVLYHPPRIGVAEDYDIPAFAEILNDLKTPVLIARGNCDPEVYEELLQMPVQSPYALADIDGVRIVVSHGHLIDRPAMVDLARRYKARYFISGHTHVPDIEPYGDVTLLNPGSPAHPKFSIECKPAPSVGIITEHGAKVICIDDGKVLRANASN